MQPRAALGARSHPRPVRAISEDPGPAGGPSGYAISRAVVLAVDAAGTRTGRMALDAVASTRVDAQHTDLLAVALDASALSRHAVDTLAACAGGFVMRVDAAVGCAVGAALHAVAGRPALTTQHAWATANIFTPDRRIAGAVAKPMNAVAQRGGGGCRGTALSVHSGVTGSLDTDASKTRARRGEGNVPVDGVGNLCWCRFSVEVSKYYVAIGTRVGRGGSRQGHGSDGSGCSGGGSRQHFASGPSRGDVLRSVPAAISCHGAPSVW